MLTYLRHGQSLQQTMGLSGGLFSSLLIFFCQVRAIGHAKASSTLNHLQAVFMKWFVKSKFTLARTWPKVTRSALILSHSFSVRTKKEKGRDALLCIAKQMNWNSHC